MAFSWQEVPPRKKLVDRPTRTDTTPTPRGSLGHTSCRPMMSADTPWDGPIRRMHAYPTFFVCPHSFNVKSVVTSTYGVFISHLVMQVMQLMHFQYFRRGICISTDHGPKRVNSTLSNSPTGWCTEFFMHKCGWTQRTEALHGLPSLRLACAFHLRAVNPRARNPSEFTGCAAFYPPSRESVSTVVIERNPCSPLGLNLRRLLASPR